MDGQCFDAVVKRFSGTGTRRGVLVGALGGLVAGLRGIAETDAARNRGKHKGRKSQKRRQSNLRIEQGQGAVCTEFCKNVPQQGQQRTQCKQDCMQGNESGLYSRCLGNVANLCIDVSNIAHCCQLGQTCVDGTCRDNDCLFLGTCTNNVCGGPICETDTDCQVHSWRPQFANALAVVCVKRPDGCDGPNACAGVWTTETCTTPTTTCGVFQYCGDGQNAIFVEKTNGDCVCVRGTIQNGLTCDDDTGCAVGIMCSGGSSSTGECLGARYIQCDEQPA